MITRLILLISCITLSLQTFAQNIHFFPLEQVRLLDSPFKHAQNTDLTYIMAMDPDKLLAPFLRQAGLSPRKNNYGNWESMGLDGHIGGHYLTALSLAWASTGEPEYKNRLNYMLEELKRAQDANGDGYIGGVPNSHSLWNEIKGGNIRAQPFNLNGGWVPWYNLHKTYAGLRDAYLLGKSPLALEILTKLGNWTLELTKNLSDRQIQRMLYAEHGGLNEVFADYYAITHDRRYLTLARKFSEHRILDPLLSSFDQLTGLHANTQIPKVVGFARIAQLDNDTAWRHAAEYFWSVVAHERSVAIGGNSVREYFHDKYNFMSVIEEIQGPESCNTYNMLKLSALLYANQGTVEYVDFYERALYNHILSSQHPVTGGLVYFTPMRPQHYRVYSQVDQAMWCCVGSGIESHLQYGKFIYANKGDELFVNLFIPSRLVWKERNVILRQENMIPDQEFTRLTIERGGYFKLNIRKPKWLKSDMTIQLNGQNLTIQPSPDNYITMERRWQSGDVLNISLPMRTQLESLPDGRPYYAVIHGPFVLSSPVQNGEESLNYFSDGSRMGHVPSGQQCSLLDAPIFVSDNPDVLDKITRVPGPELKFVAPNLIGNTSQQLELIPFFRVHESRYMIYWQMTSLEEYERMRQEREEQERERLELEARTLDRVAPGEQQPEVEHTLKGNRTETGIHLGRRWRHAYDWFSYDLKNPDKNAHEIRLTLFGGDVGRSYQLILNGVVIETIHTDNSVDTSSFYDRNFLIPEAVRNSATIEFKLQAIHGSIAGGLYGLRLLKQAATLEAQN